MIDRDGEKREDLGAGNAEWLAVCADVAPDELPRRRAAQYIEEQRSHIRHHRQAFETGADGESPKAIAA